MRVYVCMYVCVCERERNIALGGVLRLAPSHISIQVTHTYTQKYHKTIELTCQQCMPHTHTVPASEPDATVMAAMGAVVGLGVEATCGVTLVAELELVPDVVAVVRGDAVSVRLWSCDGGGAANACTLAVHSRPSWTICVRVARNCTDEASTREAVNPARNNHGANDWANRFSCGPDGVT
jgi:hypothetical protein